MIPEQKLIDIIQIASNKQFNIIIEKNFQKVTFYTENYQIVYDSELNDVAIIELNQNDVYFCVSEYGIMVEFYKTLYELAKMVQDEIII